MKRRARAVPSLSVLRSTIVVVVIGLAGCPTLAWAAEVLTQFEGLANSDNLAGGAFHRPDANLAVGPNHIFEIVNHVGRITDKNGQTISSFGLGSFFQADSSFSQGDPRVIYDSLSGRWFATYMEDSASALSSSIILAVSTSSDPTGAFCLYRLGNPTSETFIQDFPTLGVSDDKVVISYRGEAFGTHAFLGAGYYVLNKADLTACAAPMVTRVAPDPSLPTAYPVQSLSSTSTLYMVAHPDSASGSDLTSLTLLAIAGVPGITAVTSTRTMIAIRSWRAPPNALQAGSAVRLFTAVTHVLSAAWQDNSLWLAGNEACTPPGDTLTRSCLRVIEVRTDTLTVRQDLTFGQIDQYYFYPALRPDSAGNLYIVFTQSSAVDFASVRVTSRRATDPLNTLQPSVSIRAGGGANTDTTTDNMGDYNGAAVDPSDPSSVWVIGEYIRSTADADWGTYVARLHFLAPATLISPSGMITTSTPTYTWNAVAGATWYDLWVNDSAAAPEITQWYTAAQAGCAAGTGTCSVTPSTALAGGAATWWIQTWNPAGYGPWSTGMSFTVPGGPPGPVTLLAPSGPIATTMPTYTWNAVAGATWYYLWVNDSAAAPEITQWYTAAQAGCAAGTGTCSVTPSTALAGGAATWWIQTWNPAGYGPWSTGMAFTVP